MDGNNAELVLVSEDLVTLLPSTEYIPRRPNVEIADHIPRRDISDHSRSRCRSGLRRSATITNIHAVTEEMLMLVPPLMDPLMDPTPLRSRSSVTAPRPVTHVGHESWGC